MRPPPPEQAGLTITEAASHLGMTVRALRYYEESGLISPHRTGGNARRYSGAQLERLQMIAGLRLAGVQVAAIGKLIRSDQPQTVTKRVDAIIANRRNDLHAELEQLDAFAVKIKQVWPADDQERRRSDLKDPPRNELYAHQPGR